MGTIIKVILLIGLILFGVFVYLTCSGSSCMCQPIDKTLPSAEDAPYQINTKTHIYYAADAEPNDDGSVRMTDWYERDAGEWVFREDTLIIPKLLQPEINRR